MENQLGINLWNWENRLSDRCLGLPEKIKKMGFTAIEIPMTDPYVSDELIREIKKSGLRVSLCAAMGEGRDLSNFDEHVRAQTMQYLKACLETGAQLQADVFAGPLYAGGGKRHWLSEEEKKHEWNLAVTGLQELAKHAQLCGVKLALEPLCRYRTSVINTVDQVLKLIADIGENNVGVHFDTYQACIEEADLLGALERVLQCGKLSHLHACANNRGVPGDGIMPWKEIFELLRKYGYNGHITMETFALGGLDSSWVNVLGTPDEQAVRGITYLRREVV